MSDSAGLHTQIWKSAQLRLALLAVAAGLVAAYAALGFRLLIGSVQYVSFGYFGEDWLGHLATLPWWMVMGVPVAGGLVVGGLIWLLRPDERVHAVQDAIEAAAFRDGAMRLRDGLSSAFISAVSLGVGSSTGREGPMVHLGASLAGALSRRIGLDAIGTRTLLGSAVAAAVAASFNAPIAGTLFALEVVLGHYSWRAFAPITLASVTGTIVTRTHLGAQPAFVIPDYQVMAWSEYGFFIGLGLIAGFVAALFVRSTLVAQDFADRSPIPVPLRPALAGVLIGAMALYTPHILGVGYEATDLALHEKLPLMLVLLLVVAKIAATSISIAGRFGGGVFSPALFIGAMLGSAYGILVGDLFPALTGTHGLYALVGMGAVAGAVLGAPISTILIVFELTGDYQTATALMVATVIASVISQSLGTKSFFASQLARKGIDLEAAFALRLAQRLGIEEIVTPTRQTIAADLRGEEARSHLRKLSNGTVFVLDDEDKPIGLLSETEVRKILFAATPPDRMGEIAADPCSISFDTGLEQAIALLEAGEHRSLPVVDRKGVLMGVIHAQRAIKHYADALVSAEREAAGDR